MDLDDNIQGSRKSTSYWQPEGDWIDGRPIEFDDHTATKEEAIEACQYRYRFLSGNEQKRVRSMWVREYNESGSVGKGVPVELAANHE